MDLYRRLGRAVAERRNELELTQDDVAKRLALSRASLANLENGRQRIMVHQLFALVNALKLKSVLDLVPATWTPPESLPEFNTTGASLSSQQRSQIESLMISALADHSARKRGA